MRWQALFDDLEGQVEAAAAAELAEEVAERGRAEFARLRLVDRLAAATGCPLVVAVPGAGPVRGTVADTGPDWLLMATDPGTEVLVPLGAVLSVAGLPRAVAPHDDPGSAGAVARALDLRWVLRRLARARTGVLLVLRDGSAASGTLDRVAADHLDLAEHPQGEPRRAGAVRAVRAVPLAAVSLVRSG